MRKPVPDNPEKSKILKFLFSYDLYKRKVGLLISEHRKVISYGSRQVRRV